MRERDCYMLSWQHILLSSVEPKDHLKEFFSDYLQTQQSNQSIYYTRAFESAIRKKFCIEETVIMSNLTAKKSESGPSVVCLKKNLNRPLPAFLLNIKLLYSALMSPVARVENTFQCLVFSKIFIVHNTIINQIYLN